MTAKIEARNLVKIYGENTAKALELFNRGCSRSEIIQETGLTVGVAGVNFEIAQGEVFVIIGLSGSGKSTLLRCINGLLMPTSGSLLVDGNAVEKLNDEELRKLHGEKISMVFQHFALLPNRTITDNVAFGLELRGTPFEERRQRAQEALIKVGLEEWKDKFPSELSGGMKQRVGLARALVMDSDILLMDEPFSALDALIRAEMQEELISLQQEIKKTVVFVTHDLDEALRLGDRIAIMRDGAIEQIGTADEILSNPANEYVEKFLQGIDVSKILDANSISKWPREVIRKTESVSIALHRMKKADMDYLFVLGARNKLVGMILREDVLKLAKDRQTSIKDIIKETNTVQSNTIMRDVYHELRIAEKDLAVVDDKGRFLGVITHSVLLMTLDERKGGDGIAES
ncbi:MAG: glycine betaine/L-proline ABC transporter ATP-binding protein [Dehalococcoidales bacterium]|jgi:glycine betaine/proline transport system ATP-binding protein|nr:glycine betaine/L-proline ABC transporter ATP-binding protein [Dehalococcoidales bacterium]